MFGDGLALKIPVIRMTRGAGSVEEITVSLACGSVPVLLWVGSKCGCHKCSNTLSSPASVFKGFWESCVGTLGFISESHHASTWLGVKCLISRVTHGGPKC